MGWDRKGRKGLSQQPGSQSQGPREQCGLGNGCLPASGTALSGKKQSQERTRGFGHLEATGGLEESCFGEVGQSHGCGSEEAGEEHSPEQKRSSSEPAGGINGPRGVWSSSLNVT